MLNMARPQYSFFVAFCLLVVYIECQQEFPVCNYDYVEKSCIGDQTPRWSGGSVPVKLMMGGTTYNSSDYPFVVSLQEAIKEKEPTPELNLEGCYSHFCGGTLISPNLVLTAAHCFEGRRLVGDRWTWPSESLYVSISPQCRHLKSGKEGKRILVDSVYIHPKYTEFGVNYDIAIVSLLGYYSGPIAKIYDGEQDITAVTAIGYGLIRPEERHLYSVQPLKGAELGLIKEQLCRDLLNLQTELQDEELLSDSLDYITMVCAYNIKADTCEGDSGGPLLHDDKIVGIVSWGPNRECKAVGLGTPGVFTRVSEFYQWIYQMMKDYSVGPLPQPPSPPPVIEQPSSAEKKFLEGTIGGSHVNDVSVYPYSAVGRIKKGCTATVLGPNHILTVAHCIFNVTTGNYTEKKEMDFYLQQNGQDDTAIATFKSIYPFVPEGWITGRTYSEKYRYNYAVVLVEGNLSQYVPQTWSFENSCNQNINVNIIGNPDEKNQQMWYSSCKNVYVNCNSGIMYHNCYAARGMGGSPIFKVSKDSSNKQVFDILGVHFGYSGSVGKNQAVALDEKAKQQIQEWMKCDYDCVVKAVSGIQ